MPLHDAMLLSDSAGKLMLMLTNVVLRAFITLIVLWCKWLICTICSLVPAHVLLHVTVIAHVWIIHPSLVLELPTMYIRLM